MKWILIVMAGISGWGPGVHREYVFQSKEECYEALSAIRVDGASQIAGDDDEQSVMLCVPRQGTDQ